MFCLNKKKNRKKSNLYLALIKKTVLFIVYYQSSSTLPWFAILCSAVHFRRNQPAQTLDINYTCIASFREEAVLSYYKR